MIHQEVMIHDKSPGTDPECHLHNCEQFGHICCKLADGKVECRTSDNCPHYG